YAAVTMARFGAVTLAYGPSAPRRGETAVTCWYLCARPGPWLDGRVSDAGGEPMRLRSLFPSIFAPTVIYEIANGAVAPVLALSALELGASPAVAGTVVALLGLGQLLGNVPSAVLVDRLGDRRAMIVAALAGGAGMVA